VHSLLPLLLALLGAVLAGVVLFTASVNAHGNREDAVVAMPDAGADVDVLARAIGAAAGQPAIPCNRLDLYQNGDEIFPPMLDAIARARSTVHFVSYVFETGRVPDDFARVFSEAAQRGVVVRIVIDRNGAKKADPRLLREMRDAGCDVRWFRPALWYDWERYNHRSHRRLLVVDGEVGFTGGVGIADQWSGAGDSPHHWRDTHARITGPAVAALQRAFVDSWNDATEELVLSSALFPALAPTGDTTLCIVQSDPENGSSTAQRSVAALIAAARRSLLITNPYFVPPPSFVDALCAAAKRGVAVRVLMPGPYHNKPAVRRASRRTWRRLMESGVRLFEHQRTMVHAKVIVVDDAMLCVGSINFDPRSFSLNAEGAAIAFDGSLARRGTERFDLDLAQAREVTVADLDALSWTTRLVDGLAYWLRAQL
jgi:Phosphatidylserine/phosphatidylglycerophosphate/cardiolipin synthases and related enzymes